jgi:hypothetical protein
MRKAKAGSTFREQAATILQPNLVKSDGRRTKARDEKGDERAEVPQK